MCELTANVRFCTCPNVEPLPGNVEGTWMLRRYHGSDWMTLEIGRCMSLEFDGTDDCNQLLLQSLLQEADAVFDFDYLAQEGDVLNVALSPSRQYEFVFQHERWQSCTRISSHLNRHLIIAAGKLSR